MSYNISIYMLHLIFMTSSCQTARMQEGKCILNVLDALQYLACICAGKEAANLGKGLGVHVLRHESKKPDGGIAEVEQYFGCVYA